jgi:hypothetical protein
MTRDRALEVMREEASVGMWDARVIDIFAGTLARRF